MPRIQKVLFPVDFSDRRRGAAHYVEALTGRLEAELTLLHIVPSGADYVWMAPEMGPAAAIEVHQHRLAMARQQLESFLTDELKHFEVKRVLCEGDPGRQIVAHAHANQIDLIMIPSHGFGPFRRYILGSTTAKVLHDAHCPVWTGAHMEQAPPLEQIECRGIVCAVDFGPQSEAVVHWGAYLAEEYDAVLTLLHAVPGVEARPAKYFDQELTATLASRANEQMADLIQKTNVNARPNVEAGRPQDVIQSFCRDQRADLLLIGRGSAGEGGGRLRTHAYSIIRSAPCPVLSV